MSEATNAIERIALKRQMITRLSEIEARLSTPPLSNLDGMISKIVDAQNHLDSLAGKKLDPRYDAAKAEYEHLVSQRQTWIQERDNFLEQRDRIQSELDQFDHAITLIEINEQATKLLAAESAVSSLDSTIEYQRSFIMAADNVSGSTDLLRQKEDLLADAATGKNVAKRLETIETKIKEYEQNCLELTNQARKAEQAIAGLERRRAEAEKVIQAEKADLDEMLVFWFKSELQTAYSDFIAAGKLLAERFRRVAALDTLVAETSHGREKSILNATANAYRIRDITKNADGFIFDARDENPAQWAALERERQTAAGVPL
jgi:peptidoglycan hydrolase CwlO-like protein